MIDIHAHILPGLDDGPSSMEESMEMARLAYEDGTKTMVATPHNRDVVSTSSWPDVRSLVNQMNRHLDSEGIDLRLLLGMENHLEMDIPDQLEKGLAVPIENTQYILVELPFEVYPFYTDDVLFQIQLRGFRPIIVHPERTNAIQEDPQILVDLIEKGALSQVTSDSILGRFGKNVEEFTKEILKQNLVHIIASDCHTAYGSRKPSMSEGLHAAAKVVGHLAANMMVNDIPDAVVNDRKLGVDDLPKAAKRSMWGFLS